jgi:hypothetical protein
MSVRVYRRSACTLDGLPAADDCFADVHACWLARVRTCAFLCVGGLCEHLPDCWLCVLVLHLACVHARSACLCLYWLCRVL